MIKRSVVYGKTCPNSSTPSDYPGLGPLLLFALAVVVLAQLWGAVIAVIRLCPSPEFIFVSLS
jgi:hypothetical protein